MLVRNFKVESDKALQISLSWNVPVGFNDSTEEVIVTRTTTHFPMELYNTAFPNKATDSRGVEVFRGKAIVGLNTGTISVSGKTLMDTSASFSTTPKLKGRLVRLSDSKVARILDNTSTTLTLDIEPVSGKYVILADFPTTIRIQDNFELDIRTSSGEGFISNLVYISNGAFLVKEFEEDEAANLIFRDAAGQKFVVKSNSKSTLYFWETTAIPTVGPNMILYNSFVDSDIKPYLDNFKTEGEASSRTGSGLQANTYYYYTTFCKPLATNVAQADFAAIDAGTPTQGFAISASSKQFGNRLYRYWPSVFRELDKTGDLEDLMQVFGFYFDQMHALVSTYKLQDTDNVLVTALLPLSEQTGLPSVGYSLGADTLRRIGKDMLYCWKLKGSKEGIALFIRLLTTWDITAGTGDYSEAIQDVIPNTLALRFFDAALGNTNSRFPQSSPSVIPGGRFVKSLPGVVIPGFFTFREFVITIPSVALFVGATQTFTVTNNTTIISDLAANFGANNSLVGNFIIPNQAEINDVFEIISNTNTSITVRGIVTNRNAGGNYAILSPLNATRFTILNRMLPYYIPYGTSAGFIFI